MSHGNKIDSINSLFIKNIPNLLTLGNMMLGFTVLYLSISKGGQDYRVLSCILILLAAVIDAFDGTIARFLEAESEFGKQLDSFADFISFGIAPVAVLLTVGSIGTAPIILVLLVLYPLAGAFRLARFNLGNNNDYFVGLPITAAGSILACFVLHLSQFNLSAEWIVGTTLILTTTLSFMMVSNFKISRIKISKYKIISKYIGK